MYSKKLAALVATSLLVSTSAASASTAASRLSPTASLSQARAGAATSDDSELGRGGFAGGGIFAALIGIALIAAFVLVVVEDEDDDLPESP